MGALNKGQVEFFLTLSLFLLAFTGFVTGYNYIDFGVVVPFNATYDQYGTGFSNATGVFTCLTHGLYQFSSTIQSYDTYANGTVRLIYYYF